MSVNPKSTLIALTPILLFTVIYYCSNLLLRIILISISSVITWWLCLSTTDINQTKYDKLLTKRNLITDRYNINKCNKTKYDIIIIGSGTSSLHCGALLSRIGYKILILEQHYVAGGGTHEFELTNKKNKNKYTFDSGLHYAIPLSESISHLICGTNKPPIKWLKLGFDQQDNCYDWIVLGDSMKNKNDFFRIKHNEKHLNDIYKLFPTQKDKKDIDTILTQMGYAMKLFPFWVLQRLFPVTIQRLYRKYILNKLLKFKQYAGRCTKTVLDELTDNEKLKSLVCGLWLDTGAPPNICSFMLSSSVFRGFPHEGGAYPQGGSTMLAKALVAIIKLNGGNILCRAKVKHILINYNNSKPSINGVIMENNDKILCNNIISGAGYNNTFNKLFNKNDRKKLNIKYPIMPGLQMSSSFILCNIGLNGNWRDLEIEDTNLWYQPINEKNNWSIFQAIDDFICCNNPESDICDVSKNIDFCCGFTWPSIKSKEKELLNGNTTSCQILIMVPWKWFEKWYKNGEFKSGNSKNIDKDYQKFKQIFIDECIKKLYKFYPKCKDKIDFIDLSTPLSLEYYLKSDKGGAVGLDVTPNRFIDDKILDLTDCNKNNIVKGLWLTGQDFLICGIPICQAAGIITALRFAGFTKSMLFICKAIRTAFRAYLF
eukprot:437770_1